MISKKLSCMVALALTGAVACGDSDVDPGGDAGVGDADVPYQPPEMTLPWEKVEIPGTVCGNGSQYKFFISRSIGGTNSDNLLIYMEPGGACWDRASCIDGTARGAANPNGIPDDHMDLWSLATPLMRRFETLNPAWDWTFVFIPYCTGDVHAGSKTVEYPPDSEDSVTWHHQGHTNVKAVVDWLDGEYAQVPQMLLTGCSAGGAGAIANYYFVREGLSGLDRGYMLNDSGPIFPAAADDPAAWSRNLHDEIKDVWGVQELLDENFPDYDTSDFGNINDLLAEEFPQDRLSTVFFQMDYNYSLYSYERFHFAEDEPNRTAEYREQIYTMWYEDTLALKERLDGVDNHAYFLPLWREFNDSHCLTPVAYNGTEIEEAGVDLLDYIHHLLDDSQPLESHFEESCDDLEGITLDGRYEADEGALLGDLTPKCQ
jgi:hypothetical protein